MDSCPTFSRRTWYRIGQVCGYLCILFAVFLVAFFIIWAVLQPHKPRFFIQDATLYSLNVSIPHILSPTLQVRINFHNKNRHIGIYYDEAVVYAAYRGCRITYNTRLFPVYQGIGAENSWSLLLHGNSDPLDMATGLFLVRDQEDGDARITIKIFGNVKWRVVTYVSKSYHLHVGCRAYIPFGNFASSNLTYPLFHPCSVSV